MLCNLRDTEIYPKRKTAKNLIQETIEFLLRGFLFSGLCLSRGPQRRSGAHMHEDCLEAKLFPDNFCSHGITCTKVSASLLGGTASHGRPLNLLKAELVGDGEGRSKAEALRLEELPQDIAKWGGSRLCPE